MKSTEPSFDLEDLEFGQGEPLTAEERKLMGEAIRKMKERDRISISDESQKHSSKED